MKKFRNWAIGASISLAALIIAFWGLQPERLIDVFGRSRPGFLVPAALAVVLGLFARARSWHVLLGKKTEYRRAFWALNEGYLMNSVLPLRLGEVGRAYSVSRRAPVSGGMALATVVVERLIDVAVSLAALVVSLGFIAAPRWAGNVAMAGGAVLGAGILGAALLILTRKQLLELLARLPGARWIGLAGLFDAFAGGFGEVADAGRLSRSGLWSLAAWVTAWIQLAFVFLMFDLQGSLVTFVFVTGVTAFGAALPSSPGALGVFELSMLAAMTVVGYEQVDGVSVAVTAHVLQVGITGALGAVALAREGESVVSLAKRAQNMMNQVQEEATA
ncbi:MAG: lysylphosphatidylglycerol synthase transmembrane domain-containing protein [Anaerolineales bacterium]|nr:lysylphosphatidylglycerol synthase transmembrane domain-containing protein [Anaerolineales bacterium]